MSYLVAIPAYNAAATIGRVLQGLLWIRDRVLVVDDGSTDTTEQVANALGFYVLRHECNRGVGAALKSAIAHTLESRYKYLITLDADGQHPPDRIAAFEARVLETHFAIGNRFNSDLGVVHDSKLAANLAASLTLNAAFGTRLADVACGYRAFRCADWMLDLPSDGYGFLYEQLIDSMLRLDRISTVAISPNFALSTLWATRAVEILGFLSAVLRHPSTPALLRSKLAEAITSVTEREDFIYDVSGQVFHCFYIRTSDCYFVQTDVKQARRSMKWLASAVN